MKKWRVDYAYRINGEYREDEIYVIAKDMDGVLAEANSVLAVKAFQGLWDVIKDRETDCHAYMIWNIGIMMDADDEVT